MKFFNIDFHVSVIADVQQLLSELGHQVDSLSLSNHTWVFGRTKDSVPELDGMSFDSFGQRECDRFLSGRGRDLGDYDGFLVTHSPCLSGLYEGTGKPVVCVVSTRYDTFCQTPDSKAWLDDLLLRMHASGQLILLANNAYDAWHVHRHLGILPQVVPSFCGYTGARWSTPSRPPVFLGRNSLAELSALPRGHSWSDVADSAACVAIPYNVSLMSIFERHTMGMPIVVPSPAWTAQNPFSLSELSHKGSFAPEEFEAALSLADWYTGELPGISFFESEDDLRRLLSKGVPPVTGMAERKDRISENWRILLSGLPSRRVDLRSRSRPMPKSERDGNVIGFWRWCDEFFGHLRPDGTLIQHRDANLQMRFGTWTATPDGFEMELTGHWRKHVKLDGLDTGTWRLHGSPEHFGSISKLGRSPHCPPAMDRPTFPCCDGYRFFANESTIVLHTDSVLEWHRKCRPDSDYVLVTTHSDTPVDGRFRDILNDERLVKWYATNVQTPHPKLAPVPLGVSHRLALASHMDPPMCRNDFERLLGKASSLPKTKQFNVSFLTRTNPSARQRCLKATGLRNSALSREAYIEDLGSSRFCISPEGCGIDCHRTWESLCCRTIPVITWNPMVNMGLYDGLPVIVLDSWEDFHAEDFTDERYERVMGDFAPSSLRLERWLSVHAQ